MKNFNFTAQEIVHIFHGYVLCYLPEIPIFGVETIIYPFSPDNYGSGVLSDQATVSRIANTGKYFINTVR